MRDRGRHATAYSKRLDAIADLLARIGADDAALLLAEAEPVARAKDRANRVTNCDAANLDRQVAATRRQLAAIERLDAAGELDVLPGPLRAAAALRLEHPDSALQELADLAEPPLAKPTLAARLRRLVERAEDLAVPHDRVTPR